MRDMLTALSSEGVEFLVVEAFALAAHGVPRATGDIDIWVRPDVVNAQRLMRALDWFGAPVAAHGVTAQDFQTPGVVYQLGLPPNRIDLLTSIDGLDFEDAWPNRFLGTMLGRDVAVLGRQDLLKNKRSTGRAKDLLDVALLEGKS